jgi:5-methylcytosine-specific restriction endonuclease McrA
MPRNPPLRARFFVRPDGVCYEKAPPLTAVQQRAVFEAWGPICDYCGCDVALGVPRAHSSFRLHPRHRNAPAQAQIDHRVPRSRGGTNDPANLTVACERCNLGKAADLL